MKKRLLPLPAAAVLLIASTALAADMETNLTNSQGNSLMMLGIALLMLSFWRLWRRERKNRKK